ncbi:MAG TPA: hypothetical protein VMF87_08050 [Streptosporangiaceae bacterium]|nr:hypothetical protein [Streptosporangiaceae bacterium]
MSTSSHLSRDQRIVYAREFLAGARKRKVAELPPSVLIREDAELRRVLGQLLDVISESAEVLGHALDDAIDWRTPGLSCSDCEDSPSAPCSDHASDAALVDRYFALAAVFGIEVPR